MTFAARVCVRVLAALLCLALSSLACADVSSWT